ncbi:MAG: Hsp20/alpha crystallin family protein [Reyranellaceae bacterium]
MTLPTRPTPPFDPFERLHRQIDELFSNSWLTRAWPGAAAPSGAVVPSLEVSEDDRQIVATAELPGIDEKDVEVTLDDNVLTIKGEKKSEREEQDEKKNYRLVERSYGSFRRSIALDADVDAKNVKATYDKGVLKIVLPKTPQQQGRTTKIDISRA